jgi:glycosyltransferase involved in cell wall biosynthesis
MRGLDIRELVGIHITKFDLAANVAMGLFLAGSFKGRFTDFDILFSHQQPAHWIAYRSKRPYVVQIHSFLSLLYPERFKTFPWDTDFDRIAINMAIDFGGRPTLRQIDQASIRGARSVLVQGSMLSRIIHEIYGVTPVKIPYAVDLSTYLQTNPRKVFARYSVSPPLILTVTRALPSKRPDLMIRILPRILKDHPSATLVIVCGRSPYQIHLRRLAGRLGVAGSTRILTVSSAEVNALYSGASVVGYPAQGLEAVGRVPIEAMCFGVPPVVWDNEWGPSEVVKDGVGFRARPYDADDFADKVLTLLNDSELRSRMGAEAKLYSKSFSWERVGPIHERVLKAAIS